MKKILFVFLMFLSLLGLSSCVDPLEGHYNLFFATVIYSVGEQEVDIKVFQNKQDTIEFKETIKKEDVELFGVLASKTVEKVTYQSKSHITVTMSGACDSTVLFKSGVNIKAVAMNTDYDCSAAIKEIPEPVPYINSYAKIYSLFGDEISATLVLPLTTSAFIENNLSTGIYLENSSNGSLEVVFQNNRTILVKISNFTASEYEKAPVLVFSSNTTDLNFGFRLTITDVNSNNNTEQ